MILLLIRHQQDLRLKLFTTLRWCAAYSIQFYFQRKCIYINNLKNPFDRLFLNQNKRFRLNYSQFYQVIHYLNALSRAC